MRTYLKREREHDTRLCVGKDGRDCYFRSRARICCPREENGNLKCRMSVFRLADEREVGAYLKRLQAAAPEMLEALMMCYAHIKNNYQINGIIENCKSAIERATGMTIEDVVKEQQ